MPSHTRTIPQNMRNTFSINHQLVAPLIIPNAREKERQKERRDVHAPPSSFKYFERIFFSQIFEEAEVTTRRNGAIPDDSRDDNERFPLNQSRCRSGGVDGRKEARVSTKEGILSRRGENVDGEIKTKTRERKREKKSEQLFVEKGLGEEYLW